MGETSINLQSGDVYLLSPAATDPGSDEGPAIRQVRLVQSQLGCSLCGRSKCLPKCRGEGYHLGLWKAGTSRAQLRWDLAQTLRKAISWTSWTGSLNIYWIFIIYSRNIALERRLHQGWSSQVVNRVCLVASTAAQQCVPCRSGSIQVKFIHNRVQDKDCTYTHQRCVFLLLQNSTCSHFVELLPCASSANPFTLCRWPKWWLVRLHFFVVQVLLQTSHTSPTVILANRCSKLIVQSTAALKI